MQRTELMLDRSFDLASVSSERASRLQDGLGVSLRGSFFWRGETSATLFVFCMRFAMTAHEQQQVRALIHD
jgi:hypothetical protein